MTERHGRCIVAVSEGVHDEGGQEIAVKLAKQVERDAPVEPIEFCEELAQGDGVRLR